MQLLSLSSKTEYKYSLLFFSGCLCSFGLLHLMIGVDQAKDHGSEDDIASIYLYITGLGGLALAYTSGGIKNFIAAKYTLVIKLKDE